MADPKDIDFVPPAETNDTTRLLSAIATEYALMLDCRSELQPVAQKLIYSAFWARREEIVQALADAINSTATEGRFDLPSAVATGISGVPNRQLEITMPIDPLPESLRVQARRPARRRGLFWVFVAIFVVVALATVAFDLLTFHHGARLR